MQDSREEVASVMADISTDMSNKLDEMLADVESGFGNMAEAAGEQIRIMQQYIDSLQGKDVYINIKPGATGTTGSIKPSERTVATASTASVSLMSAGTDTVPYLASGAVIPPNAPFVAVLGDQRNGRNLEAPEDLIRQIIREESANVGGSYRFTAEIDRRVLFDQFIEEAKARQTQNGQDPFELI